MKCPICLVENENTFVSFLTIKCVNKKCQWFDPSLVNNVKHNFFADDPQYEIEEIEIFNPATSCYYQILRTVTKKIQIGINPTWPPCLYSSFEEALNELKKTTSNWIVELNFIRAKKFTIIRRYVSGTPTVFSFFGPGRDHIHFDDLEDILEYAKEHFTSK